MGYLPHIQMYLMARCLLWVGGVIELQDEIAQTLLGINVRLLSLKRESSVNTGRLKNEIASTQRLVAK